LSQITGAVASLLDWVITKGDASSKPGPNDAFLTLAGHSIEVHSNKIRAS
jgi:hypothetical protein